MCGYLKIDNFEHMITEMVKFFFLDAVISHNKVSIHLLKPSETLPNRRKGGRNKLLPNLLFTMYNSWNEKKHFKKSVLK